MKTLALFAAGMDIGDIIQLAVAILVVAGGAIAQMIKAAAKDANRKNVPPVAKPRPAPQRPQGFPNPQQAPQRPVAAQPDAVRDEIEKFLRRVSDPQSGGASKKKRPRPAQFPKKEDAELVVTRPKTERRLVEANPVEMPSQVGGRVAKQVDQYLDESQFTKRAEHLGEKVSQSDDRLEKHLKSIFDHKLGNLDQQAGDLSAVPSVASSVAAPASSSAAIPAFSVLFGNPNALCNAIIVNEILRRPEERWEV